MRILIVSAAFYPANSPRSFRTTELSKELASQGHDVVVVTPHKGKIQAELAEKWKIQVEDPARDLSQQFSSAYFRIPVFSRYLNRALEWFFEFPDIQYYFWVKKSVSFYNGFDVMISVAAPHAIHWGIATFLKSCKQRPAKIWIADCGDPFMGAKMNKLPKMPWFSILEHRFCKLCDFITVPIENAVNAYYTVYQSKIRVIPQGFNFEDSISLRKPYKKNEIPTFGFAGSLSPGKRDPGKFLQFLLEYDKPYFCVFYTNMVDLVKPYAEKSKGRIEIRPYVPRTELFAVMSTMDFLVNIENEVSEQLPSKLIDYYLMGRPVLSINAKSDINKVVLPFLAGDYSQALVFEKPEKFNIKNVAESFIKLADGGL